MGKWTTLREKILLGESDANIPFEDLRHLLLRFGLDERVRGSHHIFSRSGIEEILNLHQRARRQKPIRWDRSVTWY